jgi:hypothetical protein
MELSGNDYAKVAERLRLFREDHPKSKTDSAYEYEVDKTVVFTVWLWKDKTDYLDVLKEVKDAAVARGSADANGTAKGAVGEKQKDFEKLETIALGRALAMLGYLASGEIASSEEMEAFEEFREQQEQQRINQAIEQIKGAKSNDELNAIVKSISNVLKYPEVVEAGKSKRTELAEKAEKADKPAAPKLPVKTPEAKPKVETPLQVNPKSHGPSTAPALPLDEGDDADS